MPKLAGTGGSVTINSAPYCISTASVDYKIDVDNVTTTCSGGFQEVIGTIKHADGNFNMPIDPSNVPTLEPGDFAMNLVVLEDATHGLQISTALILGYTSTIDVTKAVTRNYSFQSSGSVSVLPAP